MFNAILDKLIKRIFIVTDSVYHDFFNDSIMNSHLYTIHTCTYIKKRQA